MHGHVPSDGMEQAQGGEGGADVHGMQKNEADDPLHSLLSSFSHEGRDPQHTPTEALQPVDEALHPLLTVQVLKGTLDHRRVHGHQTGAQAHIS